MREDKEEMWGQRRGEERKGGPGKRGKEDWAGRRREERVGDGRKERRERALEMGRQCVGDEGTEEEETGRE